VIGKGRTDGDLARPTMGGSVSGSAPAAIDA